MGKSAAAATCPTPPPPPSSKKHVNSSCCCFILLLLLISRCGIVEAVARFAIKSVSTRSVVIEMVDAKNVSRFDMRVLIYDLDKLREFRRSELTGARYNAQLFSFDGLIPANWFAFRIEYRLVYDQQQQQRAAAARTILSAGGTATPGAHHFATAAADFATKQELIVRTRPEQQQLDDKNVAAAAGLIAAGGFQQSTGAADIDDELVQFERLQLFPDLHQLNVTLRPTLAMRPRVSTLVVAELRCARGTVKPRAVEVPNKGTLLSFDLRRVHPGPLSQRNALGRLKCLDLCVFPFIRVASAAAAESSSTNLDGTHGGGGGRQTFRAREICESLQEAPQQSSSLASGKKKLPGGAGGQMDELLQQKLLDRHFRSSLTSTARRAANHRFVTAIMAAHIFLFVGTIPLIRYSFLF